MIKFSGIWAIIAKICMSIDDFKSRQYEKQIRRKIKKQESKNGQK